MAKRKLKSTPPLQMPPPGCILNERQAAVFLGKSVSWMQHQRWKRLPPAYVQFGRSIGYTEAQLNAYIASRTVEPLPPSKRLRRA